VSKAAQVASDFACVCTSAFLAACVQVEQVASDFTCERTSRHIYKYICGGVATSPPHTQIYNLATPPLKPRKVMP